MNMVKRESILTDFSKAIQSKAGHANPTILKPVEYHSQKDSVIQKVKDQSHFCERDWPEHEKIFSKIVEKHNEVNPEEAEESDSGSSTNSSDYNDQRIRYGSRSSRPKK
jgi:hypothetical protein